ncbi:hypothetical protein N7492_008602 [Penicillium capsulatum]|uniref:Sigma-70 region 2 family protein n=1 Tax=Penicillium capsulatum TaxID=69766 RepID=A0A9W9HT04_9EURO|nr:hypothetical protein N7492_008602 [Penicillium capsulatum]
MATPDQTDAPSTRWQFIDASNNSRTNLTQVKRHVMQEYMRHKKEAVKATATRNPPSVEKDREIVPPQDSHSAIEEPDCDWLPDTSDPSIPPTSHETIPLNISPLTKTPGQFTFSTYDFDDLSPQSHGFLVDWSSVPTRSSVPTTPLEPSKSPRTIMSAARTDPFNSLPIPLDRAGQELFDFYVNDMPACSYGSQFRSPEAHNWYTDVFVPEAMKGPVAFQNMILVHAANTWAWVRNETETSNTLLHRDRALTMLREHFTKNPQDISDVAIISCLSAAALEDFDPRAGHKEISWVHMRAAREMIRARGGPAAFANTRLGMLINWQDYILSGYETHGSSFHFERDPPLKIRSVENPKHSHIYSTPSPPSSASSVWSDYAPCPESSVTLHPAQTMTPIEEIKLQCEEFLDFLRRCEQLALYQRENPESCDPARHTVVSETSLLTQILAAPPGARFTASGGRKQMVARLTAIMMLNAALWDYRYTPIHGSTFLKTLEQSMIDSEVSMNGSVEAILQILIGCNDGSVARWATGSEGTVAPTLPEGMPDFTQYSPTATSPSARPWFVGRMLKIAKRLGADSWHRINDFLFSCLTLRVSEPNVSTWEAGLRREILDAPLTNYVMPSLTV